jgi:hydroxyethylthiazole kinase
MEGSRIVSQHVADVLAEVRSKQPLVHNITNFVVMNFTANALLALDASPVMAHAIEEVAEMASLASSLVINIGTLEASWIEAMYEAAHAANRKNVPIVFDPVGAGATRFRTDTAKTFIRNCAPTIIRGNGSEIASLFDDQAAHTRGVDSSLHSSAALIAARQIAVKYNTVVVISGTTDYIVGSDVTLSFSHGDPMMKKVTGMGCVATALVGACAGVTNDPVLAALCGMAITSLAGEIAAQKCRKLKRGIGDFQIEFLNALSVIDPGLILDRLEIEGAYSNSNYHLFSVKPHFPC